MNDTTDINLLDFWKNGIIQFKWKAGLLNESPFNKVDYIIENILKVFPKKDFINNGSIDFKENFIAPLTSARLLPCANNFINFPFKIIISIFIQLINQVKCNFSGSTSICI